MLGRRLALVAVAVVVAAAAFVGVRSPSADVRTTSWTLVRPASTVAAAQLPVEATTTTLPPEPPTTVVVQRPKGRTVRVGVAPPASVPATIADAVVDEVPLYSTPGQAEPDDWLDNPTWEGLPVVFLVHGRQGDWLNVQVSMRPNQATVWIRAQDVKLRTTNYHIAVDIGARHMTVYNGNTVAMEATVAPGADDSPTPTGDFFIDGVAKPSNPNGPYGAYQLSVAAFSNVYYSFGTGIGQIALHGTNEPELLGEPASHGCVRMSNDDITALVGMVPIGTPVKIF